MARQFLQILKDSGQHEVRGVFVYGPKLISEGLVDAVCLAKLQGAAAQERSYIAANQGYTREEREAKLAAVTTQPLLHPLCTFANCSRAGADHRHFSSYQPESLGEAVVAPAPTPITSSKRTLFKSGDAFRRVWAKGWNQDMSEGRWVLIDVSVFGGKVKTHAQVKETERIAREIGVYDEPRHGGSWNANRLNHDEKKHELITPETLQDGDTISLFPPPGVGA